MGDSSLGDSSRGRGDVRTCPYYSRDSVFEGWSSRWSYLPERVWGCLAVLNGVQPNVGLKRTGVNTDLVGDGPPTKPKNSESGGGGDALFDDVRGVRGASLRSGADGNECCNGHGSVEGGVGEIYCAFCYCAHLNSGEGGEGSRLRGAGRGEPFAAYEQEGRGEGRVRGAVQWRCPTKGA